MMLCINHGLIQQHQTGIQVKHFLNKCGVDRDNHEDNITKYSMTTFAGILGRQLLNMANDCKKNKEVFNIHLKVT